MAVNVVKYGDQTVMDISDSTTTSNNLLSGEVGYSANGNRVVGALTVPDELNDLGDVNITQVVDGQVLKYNSTTKKWENSNESGGSGGLTLLAYGKSTWNDFITAYTANKIVYCRASSNSDPSTGSQTRMAFMAYVNNETTPTQVEFQYYRSVSSHSDSQQGDQVYIYLLKNTGAWSVTVRNAFTKIKAGTNMTSSYSSGTLTLNATGGGGGSTVSVDTYQSSGANIADITVDGDTYSLYAPETYVYTYQDTGVNIADIEINGNTYSLYAPENGGGGGSQIYISGTPSYDNPLVEIGSITKDSVTSRFKYVAPVLPFYIVDNYYIDTNTSKTAHGNSQQKQACIDVRDLAGVELVIKNTGNYNCYGFCTEKGMSGFTVTNIVQPTSGYCRITIPSNKKYLLYDYTTSGEDGNTCFTVWDGKYFINPDYTQDNENAVDYIKNKPSFELSLDSCGSNSVYVHRNTKYNIEDVALVGKTMFFNQLISNGNFFDGTTGWTVSSTGGTISAYSESHEGKTGLQIVRESSSTNLIDFDIKTSTSYSIQDDSVLLMSFELWHGDSLYSVDTELTMRLDLEYSTPYSQTRRGIAKAINMSSDELTYDPYTYPRNNSSYRRIFIPCKALDGSVSNYDHTAQIVLHGEIQATTIENTFYISNVQVFNLSEMFGKQFAEDLYDNVSLCEKMAEQYFPCNYYGDAISKEMGYVNISERKLTGINLINKNALTTGYSYTTDRRIGNNNPIVNQYSAITPLFRVKPNTVYYWEYSRGNAPAFYFFDENKNYVDYKSDYSNESGIFTTSWKAYYCGVSISTNKLKDATYYYFSEVPPSKEQIPFSETTYQFDTKVQLNGIPYIKNNKIFWVGDIYYPTGRVFDITKKIKLSTLTWKVAHDEYSGYGLNIFVANLSQPYGRIIPNLTSCICNDYLVDMYASPTDSTLRDRILMTEHTARSVTFSKIFIHDRRYSDASSFKSSLTNTYFIYQTLEEKEDVIPGVPYQEFEQVQFTLGGADDFVDYQVAQNNRTYEVPPGHLNDEYSGEFVKVLLDKVRPCRKFTVSTSSWIANTEAATVGLYPYVAIISTGGYSSSSCPNWKVQKYDEPVPTSASVKQSLAYVEEAVFSNSGIKLYATNTPSFNITLSVN